MKPLCCVLMPSGKKRLPAGPVVDFEAVYRSLAEPGIVAAGMESLRSGPEASDGMLDEPGGERLLLCDYVVADLGGASASVLYQLGLRHGLRPASTVTLFGGPGPQPLTLAPPATIRYVPGADGCPADAAAGARALRHALDALRRSRGGLPGSGSAYPLLDDPGGQDIARLKTDVFRERAHYAVEVRDRLAVARRRGKDAVRAVEALLGDVSTTEAGVVIDLLLSLRAVGDWQGMVELVGRMARPLARSTLVREQYGLALNRLGRADEAEEVLLAVIATHGPSSETSSLLGRVYKDRWVAALRAGQAADAERWLGKAIEAYLQGFEADWRDAFPGINALTLMALARPPDPRRDALQPVVAYAVARRIAQGRPDYWDHATRVELAVLARDEAAAGPAAADALAAVREGWEPASTAGNLGLIREARAGRGEVLAWADAIEQTLRARAQAWPPAAPGGGGSLQT